MPKINGYISFPITEQTENEDRFRYSWEIVKKYAKTAAAKKFNPNSHEPKEEKLFAGSLKKKE